MKFESKKYDTKINPKLIQNGQINLKFAKINLIFAK